MFKVVNAVSFPAFVLLTFFLVYANVVKFGCINNQGVAFSGPASVAYALVDTDKERLVKYPSFIADAVMAFFNFIYAFAVNKPFQVIRSPFKAIYNRFAVVNWQCAA